MDEQADLLKRVVAALEARKGDLLSVAKATGLSYDTVLRIKNGEGDPGYSKVATLAAYLLTSEPARAA
jgi:transcriptional regulator with XRE-family HTH domain